MTESKNAIYAANVLRQKEAVPGIYGDVDFSRLPERYISDARVSDKLPLRFREYAQSALSDPLRVERIRNYTMTGDKVADAHAALIPE